MGLVQDFVGRVADPFRGASPAPKTAAVHGSGFQSPNPAVAGWLEKNPEVSEALAKVSSAVAALEGNHEGALVAFNKARERLDEAKAAESRTHYDARESGRTVDPELAKRLLRARQSALTANEEAATRAAIASNSFASTREALNTTIRFAGGLAGERAGVLVAPPVKLPKAPLSDIVAEQHGTLIDLDVEKVGIASAPIPLEDAVAIIRSSIVADGGRIVLTERGADWLPPQQRLNVEPRLGDSPVEIADTAALLGWLFGDLLADRLEAAVRAKYGSAKTYTATERRKALADLAARRLAVERVEVAAIFASWAEGNYVPLRKDTSPMALLGIERLIEGPKDPIGYTGTLSTGVVA